MEMISKAIVDGVMQAKLEQLAEPTKQHRQTALAIMTAGGYGQPLNRQERRAAEAKARKAAARARAQARKVQA